MSGMIRSAVPIWRVQYQLLGGSRRLGAILLAAVAVMSCGTLIARRLAADTPFSAIAGWITVFLAWVQSAILVLAGSNMIYRAIARDVESRMIESHRIAPLTDMGVTLGYLLGPASHTLAVVLVIALGGAIICLAGMIPLGAWGIGHAVLLCSAMTIWSMVVFAGMRPPKPVNPGGLIVAAASLSFPISFIPGAAFLINLYGVAYGAFILAGHATPDAVSVAIVLSVQFAMTLFWLAVAAVKFRRPELPALGSYRGLALLTITCTVGMIGLVMFDYIRSRFSQARWDEGTIAVQWNVSLIGAMLLAALPIGAAVQTRMLAAKGASLRGPGDRVPELLIVLVSTFLILATFGLVGWRVWQPILANSARSSQTFTCWSQTALVVLLALLTLRPAFVLAQRFPKSASAFVGLFILVAWGLPPLLDLIRAQYIAGPVSELEFRALMGLSPAGALIAIWSDLDVPLLPGIMFQAGFMLVFSAIAHRQRKQALSLLARLGDDTPLPAGLLPSPAEFETKTP